MKSLSISSRSRCIITNSTKMSSGTSLIEPTSYDQKALFEASDQVSFNLTLLHRNYIFFSWAKLRKKDETAKQKGKLLHAPVPVLAFTVTYNILNRNINNIAFTCHFSS